MTEPRRKAWCAIYANQDFLYIATHSGWRGGLSDPQGREYHYSLSIADADIGNAVLDALAASRFISPAEDPDFFDIRGRVVPAYEAWVTSTMARHAYGSKRAMFGRMKYVSLERADGSIVVQPHHHEKLEAWSRVGLAPDGAVRLGDGVSAVEVGAAVCLALARCT